MAELITVEQFNHEVRIWAETVRSLSSTEVVSGTHASGNLAIKLADYADSRSDKEPIYKVAFRFPRYGVFRSYGAGRGYKIVSGVPVKTNPPNKYRGYKLREPLDWIDKNIEAQKDKLADSVQAYYGDEILRNMLRVFDRAKIKK